MDTAVWIFVASMLMVKCVSLENSCNKSAILELAGDLTISGLFNIHTGENCSEANSTGLQQMAAAAWVVNTQNQNNFIPGIKIGIHLFDACLSEPNDVVTSFSVGECQKTFHLGLITTPELKESLHPDVNRNDSLVFLTETKSSQELLIDTTIKVLVSLNWSNVDYIFAPTKNLLESFNEKTSKRGICVLEGSVLPDFLNPHWKYLLQKDVNLEDNNTLIVMFGSWKEMIAVAEFLKDKNKSSIQWIFVPFNTISQRADIESAPIHSLVVLPSIGILHERRMHNNMNINEDEQEMYNATSMHSEKRIFINYPLFMNVALPVLNILTNFKAFLRQYCKMQERSDIVCQSLLSSNTLNLNNSSEMSKRDILMSMILSSDYIIVTAVSQIDENKTLEDFAVYEENPENEETPVKIVGEIYNEVLKREFCTLTESNSSSLRTCSHCSNFKKDRIGEEETLRSWNVIIWRSEAWVAAIAAIGAVGVVCTLAITLFIFIRLCKGDILEGNAFFSILLLLSIIFTYLSTLLFSFTYNDQNQNVLNVFCALRITATSISYALLFSIMLTRSFMLYSFGSDGPFRSHINGFVQSVLCVFILGVQIALSVQFFIIRTTLVNVEECVSLYEGYDFVVLLCYDSFLLLLLVCTSPFSVRSKRNYSEGMYFTIASLICLLIWVSWFTAYFLLPREWKDVAISGGLTATATGILVCVFIPRTYLMMNAIVRDDLASALPSLGCMRSSSLLDINYRNGSGEGPYDCVNPFPVCHHNPNFYSELPRSISLIEPEDTRTITPDGMCETYDRPTSPHKVTHL